MITTDGKTATAAWRPLAWDSAHFGFPVAQITDPDLDDDPLEELLIAAREAGTRLVYWASAPERQAPPALLREFSGEMVNRQATFEITLPVECRPDPTSRQSAEWPVSEFPQGPAAPQLLDLAIAAGHSSRFNLDPRVPRHRFQALYHTWIRRSTLHELADVVFVARHPESDEIAGFITASHAGGTAQIGLVAVRDDCRGHGIGLRLMRAFHDWMRSQEVLSATVVTQLENTAACRLYERCGYRLEQVRRNHHFWPLNGFSSSR